MFHKIKSITPLDDYILLVAFAEGVVKQYDIKPLFKKFESFGQLQTTEGLFPLVQVDTGGYGIYWNDDLDLSCNELWENGEVVTTPFDNLLAFSDATELWQLSESTLRKAVSYGKLAEGVDVKKYGKQWVITKDAMIREYGELKAGD